MRLGTRRVADVNDTAVQHEIIVLYTLAIASGTTAEANAARSRALAALARLEAERDEALRESHESDRLVEAAWRERDDETEKAKAAEERSRQLSEALRKGQAFERAYQESLGATPTTTQWERLDSLQSAFLDAYILALASAPPAVSPENTEETP